LFAFKSGEICQAQVGLGNTCAGRCDHRGMVRRGQQWRAMRRARAAARAGPL